jgi:hypothetical protein
MENLGALFFRLDTQQSIDLGDLIVGPVMPPL